MENGFFMQMLLPPHINQKGSVYAELVRKPSIASANKECSTILSNRSLQTELSIEKKFFAIKRGVLNTYAKDLNFSRICSRQEDVRDDMIPYCLKVKLKMIFRTSATNFFHCFSVSFLPVLYTVVNYPKTWFTRSFLAQSAHKGNKFYNKIRNIWFPLPTYSVLQLPK